MKIDFVCGGFNSGQIHLQPRRYIFEFCKYAIQMGVQVRVLSDDFPGLPQYDQVAGVPVFRLKNVVSLPFIQNQELKIAIEQGCPDVILWHVGATSTLHLDLEPFHRWPILTIFTSPIYRPKDLLPLGISGWVHEFRRLIIPAFGSVIPAFAYRRLLEEGNVCATITLSNSTKTALIRRGIAPNKIFLVRPGVDAAWLNYSDNEERRYTTRKKYNLRPEDFVVVYFGAPDFYRGSDTLLEGATVAAPSMPNLRLLVLSRRVEGKLEKEHQKLNRLIDELGICSITRVVDKSLGQHELIQSVAAADVVALPFKLVSAEVPLSIIEAMALGKVVIATNVDGISELLLGGRGILIPPSRSDEVAKTLMYLANNLNESRSIGKEAKQFIIDRGEWSSVANEILNLIETQIA